MTGLARVGAALGVEPEEARPVALLLALSVLNGFARILVYTAAYGLFLERFDATTLPWVNVTVAVVATTGSTLYLRLAERVRTSRLLLFLYLGLGATTLALPVALGLGAPTAVIFLLPAWYDVLYVLSNLSFWALAGRALHVRQGKRLFGLIGAAGIFPGRPGRDQAGAPGPPPG